MRGPDTLGGTVERSALADHDTGDGPLQIAVLTSEAVEHGVSSQVPPEVGGVN